jgi:phosphatidylglycerol:prolipoprotein diacylglycerol transferase
MGFRHADPDTLALAIPLGHAVGRIGCFLAGCCFGRPTDASWAVRYAPGSEPFAAQVAAGLLPADAAASLPVHPTQLYEMVLQLGLLALLLWLRPRLRRRGSLVLCALAGYGGLRFAVEFYRWGGGTIAGLTLVQWTVGVATLALLVTLLVRERKGPAAARAASARLHGRTPTPSRSLAAAPVVALVLGQGWLTPLEAMAVTAGAFLACAGLAVGSATCRRVRRRVAPAPSITRAYPGLAGLAMVALLQAGQEPDSAEERLAYTVVGLSATRGSYVETCGGAHRYGMAGGSIAHVMPHGSNTIYTIKAQAFAGEHEDEEPSMYADSARLERGVDVQQMRGIAALLAADLSWVGAEVGVVHGSVVVDGERLASPAPMAGLRVGPQRIFFVEARYGTGHEPLAFPGPALQLGVGRELASGTQLRAGVSAASGFYGSVRAVSANGWEWEPFAALADGDTWQLSLAVRKRLGGAYGGR